MLRSRTAAAGVLLLLAAGAGPALAHHAMDGAIPATFAQGLLSGLAHPIIGPDHLAALVAAGLLAAAVGAAPLLPIAFVLASLGGVGLHLALVHLPLAEVLVALTVVALGLTLLARRVPGGAPVLAALFAAAGVAHGYAYGEAIVGAEPSPLLAYLLGLTVIQACLAVGAGAAARLLAGAGIGRSATAAYRVAAGAVLLVGAGALASAVG